MQLVDFGSGLFGGASIIPAIFLIAARFQPLIMFTSPNGGGSNVDLPFRSPQL